MEDVLLSAGELAPLEGELRSRAEAWQDDYYVLTPPDEEYARAFRRYLLFTEWPELLPRTLGEDVIFYNTYYWYLMAMRLYCAKHGPDAGMRQRAFQLLEHVAFQPDWTVVEAVDRLAQPAGGSDL